jgi:hypothetical protein
MTTPSATRELLPPLPACWHRECRHEAYCRTCEQPIAPDRDDHGDLACGSGCSPVVVDWREVTP